MKPGHVIAFAFFVFTPSALPQDDVATFRVSTRGAVVWDANSPPSDAASTVWDPLTGREIHKLSYGGVEVSSRVGYEKVSPSETGKILNFTTTIANSTNSDLSVQYGGASIDERAVLPLSIALSRKGVKKRDRKDLWEMSKMYCFTTGFTAKENFFSAHEPSKTFTVHPSTALTVSSVTKDPRSRSGQCSVEGCHMIGTIRYYITVNHRDYVFVWPGRSVVYCGQ